MGTKRHKLLSHDEYSAFSRLRHASIVEVELQLKKAFFWNTRLNRKVRLLITSLAPISNVLTLFLCRSLFVPDYVSLSIQPTLQDKPQIQSIVPTASGCQQKKKLDRKYYKVRIPLSALFSRLGDACSLFFLFVSLFYCSGTQAWMK